jgi:hypothetical protein
MPTESSWGQLSKGLLEKQTSKLEVNIKMYLKVCKKNRVDRTGPGSGPTAGLFISDIHSSISVLTMLITYKTNQLKQLLIN